MPRPATRTALALALAALLAGAAFAGGCGGSGRPADPRAPRSDGYALCTIADVSGSTALERPRYVELFKQLATGTGLHGSGDLCVVLAAGDPQAEGAPLTTSVAPAHRGNSNYSPGEVAQAVGVATAQFDAVLVHPPVKRAGSALVEAAAVAAPLLHRGDRLFIASDGIQASDATGDFHTVDLSPAGRAALLDKLAGAGLLPDLHGVRVSMPLLLAHRGGLHMDQEREAAIRAFWHEWAARSGATLDPASS